MSLTECDTLESLRPVLSGGEAAIIFKHSTRCPISARARAQVEAFVADRPEVPVRMILVVESRPVSLAVADRLGVEHASPQAILVAGGAAVWDASHREITVAALERAWTSRSGS
jgi:bacillithiol system protein YtxJ